MANKNCLENMRCPKCGSEGPFYITVSATARVYDDGIDDVHDFEWEDDNACTCVGCEYRGTVDDFKIAEAVNG